MKEFDLLTISLKIQEQQEALRLPIPRNQEETYRKASDLINAAIIAYRKKYQLKPLETILSMVALNLAVNGLKTQNNKDIEPLLAELESMDAALEAYLQQETEN